MFGPQESMGVQGSRALLVGLLLAAPALAGCADEPPTRADASPGSGSPVASPAQPAPQPEMRPRGTSERWHFHDHWKGSPTITLLDADITLNATAAGGDGVPALSALVELPRGVIVPPETGSLTFNVTYDDPHGGVVNLTYRPADSNDFFAAGDLVKGTPLVLNTTESNCDVPHRQLSAWRFNLTGKPGVEPTGLPPQVIHLTITATIGRPLFIDPPHLDWWRDGETITIVDGASGELRTARTPAGNATVPTPTPTLPNATAPSVPPSAAPAPGADDVRTTYRVPVDAGRIVPEETQSLVVVLNWTSPSQDVKLALRYAENNYPSEGPMDILSDEPGSRIFVIEVAPSQTDTTYSNRTTWEFRVVPEGEPAAAFEGTFTLTAWATRLTPAAAVAQLGL